MRLDKLHVIRVAHPWKTRIYVVAVTDEGLAGIGEATLGQLSLAVVGAVRDLEPSVLGLDPHEIETLRQRALRDIYADGGQVLGAAVAGIEMACWDLIARAAGEPLFNLLGGRRQPRLRMYANGWYRGDHEPAAMGRLAREAIARGYTALKIDPFGATWRTIGRRELTHALEILQRIREAIGDEVDLIVEGHSRFSAASACRIARLLEPLHPLWFEEPVPYTDLKGYRALSESSAVPIAGGESLWRVSQFLDLLEAAPLAVVQFDPIHVGGISAARTIAQVALERNALIAPHSASGPVNELVCAHLATASSHAILLERFQDFEEEDDAGLRSSLQVADGWAQVSDTPGLGVAFELETLLARHTEEFRQDQNLFKAGWERRAT